MSFQQYDEQDYWHPNVNTSELNPRITPETKTHRNSFLLKTVLSFAIFW